MFLNPSIIFLIINSIWEATSNSTNVLIWKAILRARDEVQKKLFGSSVMGSLCLCGITTVHILACYFWFTTCIGKILRSNQEGAAYESGRQSDF